MTAYSDIKIQWELVCTLWLDWSKRAISVQLVFSEISTKPA